MSDIIKEYSVSEIVKGIKNALEKEFFYIKIRGEISNLKKHPSGHFYFSLKEDDSIINVVMFKCYSEYCAINIEDGMEVITSGKLTIYKERSNYQLLAETIKIGGIGTILKLIQERKEKLGKEGLFDEERKKSIPKLPSDFGIITAESGAALQDILARLKDRTPISILLYSVLMQGRDAPAEIIQAIKYFNNLSQNNRPEVLVITRGGGSIEDLMAFNDEELVRAVANSEIPIISAVGHEVDWTLIDYASDLRLPTPTSVAEYLTISKEQAYLNLENLMISLCLTRINKTNYKRNKLNELFRNFVSSKTDKYLDKDLKIKSVTIRIENIFKLLIEKHKRKIVLFKNTNPNKIIKSKCLKTKNKLELMNLKLNNYINKYPILKDDQGKIIKYKKEIDVSLGYILEFPDGIIRINISKE